MGNKNDNNIKIGLGIWVCFCVLVALWVFTKFLKGRQQLYSNLHVVEDSLRKMQEKIEAEQRKKSMGYVENLDEITACLSKTFNESKAQEDEANEETTRLLTTENEIIKANKDTSAEETVVEDKKNI